MFESYSSHANQSAVEKLIQLATGKAAPAVAEEEKPVAHEALEPTVEATVAGVEVESAASEAPVEETQAETTPEGGWHAVEPAAGEPVEGEWPPREAVSAESGEGLLESHAEAVSEPEHGEPEATAAEVAEVPAEASPIEWHPEPVSEPVAEAEPAEAAAVEPEAAPAVEAEVHAEAAAVETPVESEPEPVTEPEAVEPAGAVAEAAAEEAASQERSKEAAQEQAAAEEGGSSTEEPAESPSAAAKRLRSMRRFGGADASTAPPDKRRRSAMEPWLGGSRSTDVVPSPGETTYLRSQGMDSMADDVTEEELKQLAQDPMWKTLVQFKAWLPVVTRVLPLLDMARTRAQSGGGSSKEMRDAMEGLLVSHRDVRETLQEQTGELKRVEDEVAKLREVMDKTTFEQTSVTDDMRSMQRLLKNASMYMGIVLGLLVAAVGYMAFLIFTYLNHPAH